MSELIHVMYKSANYTLRELNFYKNKFKVYVVKNFIHENYVFWFINSKWRNKLNFIRYN
jgi:hypothetical protein